MQRQSSHDGVPASQLNHRETSSLVFAKNESGVLQPKLKSAGASSELGVVKVSAVPKDMNEGPNANAENHSSACGETSVAESQSLKAGSTHAFVKPKKELNPDGGFSASLSKEKLIAQNGNRTQLNKGSLVPKKELGMLERNVNIDARTHTPISGEKQIREGGFRLSEFNQVPIITKTDPDNLEPGHNPDMGRNSSTPSGGEGSDLKVQEKSLVCLHDTPISTSLSDQEKMTYSARPEKTLNKLQPRRNPDYGVHLSVSTQESNSFRIREKALDDGYNWRKYGQKLVKGNVFVRSYYKCTFSNCRAKRQIERSHDMHLTDIKYIGKHEHPKPQSSYPVVACVPPLEVRKADAFNTPASEEETSVARPEVSQPIDPAETPRALTPARCNNSMVFAVSQSHNPRDNVNDDCSPNPNPKRQKRENSSIDDNQVKKTYFKSRQVVQMMSEVDIVNDGYRWRKYGQKLVKGNPNPRSYYRCSNAGCTVKKHVERASHDPKVVITMYEGSHDHDMPASKAVAQSTAKSSVNGANMNGESGSELAEQNLVTVERVVHIGAN